MPTQHSTLPSFDPDNFVWLAAIDRFYYVPTRERRAKAGVKAALDNQSAFDYLMEKHAVFTLGELEKALGGKVWPKETKSIALAMRRRNCALNERWHRV